LIRLRTTYRGDLADSAHGGIFLNNPQPAQRHEDSNLVDGRMQPRHSLKKIVPKGAKFMLYSTILTYQDVAMFVYTYSTDIKYLTLSNPMLEKTGKLYRTGVRL
jgi:hypothetical protein